MALSCMLRGFPRTLDGHVLRSLSRSGQFSKATTMQRLSSPTCLAAAKAFSVSPRREMSAGHDHVKLWTAERALSVGLLGMIPAAFIAPCPALDYALAVAIVMHSHWGLEAVLVDYARPAVVGQALAKLSIASLYLLSVLTLGGLFYFTYSDVGLTNAVKMLWKL